ncbi:PIN domain-containing protein [bacterium]|nr:PIN domain-containing protein [bacterium]
MNLIADTSAWSLFLQRQKVSQQNDCVRKLRFSLENRDCIFLIGVILQEILDGLASEKQFNALTEYFRPFPLIECTREDYIKAVQLKNLCRKKGIQAGTIDFLIAAVCINHQMPLLTADRDFEYISAHCGLALL